jgi:hypothetical protein
MEINKIFLDNTVLMYFLIWFKQYRNSINSRLDVLASNYALEFQVSVNLTISIYFGNRKAIVKGRSRENVFKIDNDGCTVIVRIMVQKHSNTIHPLHINWFSFHSQWTFIQNDLNGRSGKMWNGEHWMQNENKSHVYAKKWFARQEKYK